LAVACGAAQVALQGDVAPIGSMGDALFRSARSAVDMCLGLIAALTLWLGIYEIAQACGVVEAMARWLAPVVSALMPELPRNSPAVGSISMNLSMCMLGIDDGALPSGLQAMRQLESHKPQELRGDGIASRAQQMFMVYMTASVALVPASLIGFRLQAGAARPGDVLLPLRLDLHDGGAADTGVTSVVHTAAISRRVLPCHSAG
jgi:spore maturation protein SpmA